MPNISQHLWKCAWTTTSLRPQRGPNDSTSKILDMQNSHQAWKIHQFFQETSSNRDTGTSTLGNTILNRYPALNTHTHQGMENSNTEAFPCLNYYADATPQMETSRQRPGADSTPSGKDPTVTSS